MSTDTRDSSGHLGQISSVLSDILLFLLVLFLIVPSVVLGQQLNHDASDETITGGVLRIKITEQAKPSAQLAQTEGVAQMGIASIDQLSTQYDVARMERVFSTDSRHAERHAKWGLDRWYRVHLDTLDLEFTRNAVSAYHADANVELAEHVLEKKLTVSPVEATERMVSLISRLNEDEEFIPDDPRYDDQWHFDNTGQSGGTPGADISLPQAHAIQTGSSDVVVQVVDSGIDLDHPDLQNSLWVNPCEEEDGTDTCGNGYDDDVHGYNFADGNSDVDAGESTHGVHVSGTIAATNNNGEGVASVAGGDGTLGSGVRIMTGRTFGDDATGGFAEAIRYGADNGAVITNNSWGYTEPGTFEQAVLDAMDYFISEAGGPNAPLDGGLVVVAAGNEDDGGEWYPAFYDPVMSVAATDRNDERASFSNYGEWVDIAAPGKGIISTVSGGEYGSLNGTSMASPHIAGIAALVVSEQSGLTPQQLRRGLVATGNAIKTDRPTGPRANAFAALRTLGVPPATITDLSITSPTVAMRVSPGDVVELEWTAPGDAGDQGQASQYDLRYSTEGPIETEADFDAATSVEGLPSPQEAGTTESVEAKGIPFDTEVHFAVRAIDPFGEVSGISNSPSTLTRSGPELSINPESVEVTFAPNEEVTRSILLENIGPSQSELEYEISEASDFITEVTPQTGVLSSGEEATVAITIRSEAADFGSYEDEIVVSTNEVNPTERSLPVRVEVEPGDPEIAVDPEALSFGTVLKGDSASQTISMQNSGGDVLEISAITSSQNAFTVDREGPIEIPYDGSVTEVEVTFRPEEVTSFEEKVLINHNASNEADPVEITVTGEGVIPIISVNPMELAFGNTEVGETSNETLTIENTGSGPLRGTISLSEDESAFTLTEGKGDFSVAPGEARGLDVAFDPKEAVDFEATITVSHNADNASDPIEVKLTGEGSGPVIVVNSEVLAFGEAIAGETITETLTIENTGDASLTGTANLSEDSDGFALNEGDQNFTVAPSEVREVEVSFVPEEATSFEGTVTINHNAGNVSDPVEVGLTGEATPASPIITQDLNDTELATGTAAPTWDLTQYAEPPATNSGPLTFSASSSNPAVASADVEGSILSVTPSAVGKATIEVTAETEAGGIATLAFVADVNAFSITTMRSFGDPRSEASYRLVGLPGQVDKDVGTTLSGEAGTTWRVFRETGNTTGNADDYLQAYDGSEAFRFAPGRGFWMLSREDWTVDATVDAVELSDDSTTTVLLTEGWNILSNPLDQPVAWDATLDLSANAGLTETLWQWDGSWNEASRLNSARDGNAYYLFNNAGLDALTLQHPAAADDETPAVSARPESAETLRLTATLAPESGEVDISEDETVPSSVDLGTVTVGRAPDSYTTRQPPAHFMPATFYVESSDETAALSYLLQAEEPGGSVDEPEGAAFDLRIDMVSDDGAEQSHGDPAAHVALHEVLNDDQFAEEEALLIMPNGTHHDLRSMEVGDPVEVRITNGSAELRVLIGTEAFVDEELQVPESLTFGPVYPNPSRGPVTIEVGMPEAADAEVALYDMLGRRVATLHNGELPRGLSEVQWAGDSLASGMYFLRLRSEGQTFTEKVVRVR